MMAGYDYSTLSDEDLEAEHQSIRDERELRYRKAQAAQIPDRVKDLARTYRDAGGAVSDLHVTDADLDAETSTGPGAS